MKCVNDRVNGMVREPVKRRLQIGRPRAENRNFEINIVFINEDRYVML